MTLEVDSNILLFHSCALGKPPPCQWWPGMAFGFPAGNAVLPPSWVDRLLHPPVRQLGTCLSVHMPPLVLRSEGPWRRWSWLRASEGQNHENAGLGLWKSH